MGKNKTIFLVIFLIFLSAQFFSQTGDPKTSNQDELTQILEKSAEYCKKLSSAVLDFICNEKISEEINSGESGGARLVEETDYGAIYDVTIPKNEKNTYIYDYQMIRKDNKISDRRILLRENGDKKNEVDVQIKTKRFKHHNLIFGPIALLAELMQPQYNYKIIEREKFKGDKVVVIEATPKNTNKTDNPYGKLWIKEDDFSIVKIEWNQDSLPNQDFFVEDAEKFNSRPEIKIYTEYAFEKNGIRFPSKYSVIETYYRKGKKNFIRSRMFVTYKDYKFFTVESVVKR